MDGGDRYLILEGEDFVPTLTVFFGSQASPTVQWESANKMLCRLPVDRVPTEPSPVILVRADGVVYPTPHYV